jgi:hypothetical protein
MSKATGKRRLKARAQMRGLHAPENADEVCCICGRAVGFDQATFDAPDGSPRVYCLDCFAEGLLRAKR